MCCGCGGFGHIDPGAYAIAELNEGDEIILKKGFGHPETNMDETKIILKVDGFSAICTDGTLLSCHDGNGLTRTGRNLPINPSFKIYVLEGKILFRRLWSSASHFASNLEDNIWYFQYRLKEKIKRFLKK